MTSGLKAKLRAMQSGQPSIPSPRPKLRVIDSATEKKIPAGGEEAALTRMGFYEPWPGWEKCLFLDTETTGLSGAGTIAFLIGVGWLESGQMRLRQYLMGDYPDETEMLLLLSELMKRFDLIVTFNGKTFDLPLLHSRYTVLRMREAWQPPPNLDLLPPARRLWRRRLGSVRLSMLEEKILQIGREDDLPGREAPARFFEMLKTGNARVLDGVVEHNRQDVATMPMLLAELLRCYANPDADMPAEDLYSLGLVEEKRGVEENAVRLYKMAASPKPLVDVRSLRAGRAGSDAFMRLGRIYRKNAQYDRAMTCYRRAVLLQHRDPTPLIEMAKIQEHHYGDIAAALECAQRAMSVAQEESVRSAINHRIERLLHKAGREQN